MKGTMISEFVTEACVAAVRGEEYTLADVCEISDKILHIMHPDMNHESVEGITSSYPKKSQALFGGYLGEVCEALEEMGLEYNTHNSLWEVASPGSWVQQSLNQSRSRTPARQKTLQTATKA